MESPRKKNLKSTDPRRNPKNTSSKSPSRRIDTGTVILIIVALILLVLVILFLGRGRDSGPDGGFAGAVPSIERVETVAAPERSVEPVLELGTPESNETEIEETVTVPDPVDAAGQSTARLFFVKVSDEGKIGMKSILRNVPSSGSPLTVAVRSLLDGPKPGELSNGIMSLIPEGSRLLGARVEDGIAFLDFNEEFRFNTLGIEGYRAQVEQIVYTVTEFSTVDNVQFLVEGQRIDYLGGEGFYVGAPLGRDDF